MKPTTLKERYKDPILEEDTFDKEDDGMSDEDLKIESLKIATNICKLMNNVLPEDIIEVAEKVAQFIKNGGELSVDSSNTSDNEDFDTDDEQDEDTSDFEEDFVTNDESTEDNTDEETSDETNTEETEEDFEV